MSVLCVMTPGNVGTRQSAALPQSGCSFTAATTNEIVTIPRNRGYVLYQAKRSFHMKSQTMNETGIAHQGKA